jgi:hypothetical protein
VLLDPFGNLGQILVLLSNVVFFAEVDKEDNGFGGKKEKRVDNLDLTIGVSKRSFANNGIG